MSAAHAGTEGAGMANDDIVWLIWDDTPGAFFRVDRIFEDADDAREYIKGKPHLRGESQKFVRRVTPEEVERVRKRVMDAIRTAPAAPAAHDDGPASPEQVIRDFNAYVASLPPASADEEGA